MWDVRYRDGRRCDSVCRRESVVGALAFAEPRPNQQREPGNRNSPARSDSDQPHHVQAADVLELWTPQNINKRREAREQWQNY